MRGASPRRFSDALGGRRPLARRPPMAGLRNVRRGIEDRLVVLLQNPVLPPGRDYVVSGPSVVPCLYVQHAFTHVLVLPRQALDGQRQGMDGPLATLRRFE